MIGKHDILKLGRMKFKIKEFRTETDYFSADEVDDGPNAEFSEVKNVEPCPEEEKDQICRFCWMEAETEDNPKIKACKCEGSVKYIHFLCLKQWLESKMTTKYTDNHHTLSWKQFECELCKMHFAYSFKYKGAIWNLVEWKRPEDSTTPYIILESLDIEKNSSRIIHTVMINEQKNKFSLGRGHESDLRINDISVSRLHAHLEYKDGSFVLVDCRSKFGTLALHKGNIQLEVDQPKTL